MKSLETNFKLLEDGMNIQFTAVNAKLDTLITVTTNSVPSTPAVAAVVPGQKTEQTKNVESVQVTAAAAGPVAAVVPVDKLPPQVFSVKVEEIEAIVQNRALFTPMLKLNGILDLCAQRRAEVA